MQQFNSADEVLDFAISKEEESIRFYSGLARKTDEPIGGVLQDFAKEEQGHKDRLLQVKADKKLEPAAGKIRDLKIGDYLADVEAEGNLDYQQALIVAMKREKVSFQLYTLLEQVAPSTEMSALMRSLAQEEARHKLRFEVEYDQSVLQEN